MGTQGANTGFKVFLNQQDAYYAGSLWGWGYNNYGGLGNGTTIHYSSPIQIGSLTNWKQVSSTTYNTSAGIKTDGTLWAWGRSEYGQLGNGTTINYSSPIQIGALTNWKQVVIGYSMIAIKTDGTLWTCGFNYSGQLGNGTVNVYYSSPIQVGSLTNWSQVSSTIYTVAAIKTDGTLWTWGYNGYGNLGNGNTIHYSSPIQVGALTNWSSVYAGQNGTAAIKTDGTLWVWGWNGFGGLGNGTRINYSSPIQVGLLTNWKQVSMGYGGIAAVKTDGTLWTCGYNNFGQLGNGTVNVYYSSPIQVGSLTNWSQVDASNNGWDLFAALKTDGTLWVCGYNRYGQLGNQSTSYYSSPIQIGSLNNWGSVSVSSGGIFAIPSSTLVVDRQQDLGQRYVSKDYLLDVYPQIASATGARTSAGLWACGLNDVGLLGNGNTIGYSSPIQIGALTNWKQVSSARGTNAAIKTNGTLWIWGGGSVGQLGNGTNGVFYSSPIQIGALTNWKQVSVGQYLSASVKTDGTLWTWGGGGYGSLGNGTTINYSSPIQVGVLTNWKQVSCGAVSSFSISAIKTDGTLWSWGDNSYGQIGNGTTTRYSSPIQLGSLTNWKQVSEGGQWFTFAVKTDGTLWAWGFIGHGQLGNQNVIDYSSPIQVGSLTNWKQVSCGAAHSAATKTDGTLWAWGFNGTGELGNGTIIKYSSPIQVGSLTNWKQVSLGQYNTAAIKTDGTMWIWAGNEFGNLGNGTTTRYSSPIQVGSLSSWKSVACSYGILAIADGYY